MKLLETEPIEELTDRRMVLAVLGGSLAASTFLLIAGISREFIAILVLVLVVAVAFAWRGHLRLAGWLGPLAGLVVFALLMLRNMGIRDTAVLGLPVTIIAGSLMNGRRGVVVFGLASLAVVAGLGAAEWLGLAQISTGYQNSLADYLIVAVTISLTIAIQWTVVGRLDERNRRAKSELAERRQAEVKLRYLESLYRHAIDAAGAVPYYRDFRANSYTYMGEGILQLTGYSPAEMTPELWESLEQEGFPRGRLAGMSYQEAERFVEENESAAWECDYRIRTRDGQTRWVADTAVLGFDLNGELTGVVGILQDITDRKQAEENASRTAGQLAMLNDIGRAVSELTDLDAVLEMIRTQLEKVVEFDFYSVRLFDEETQMIKHMAVYENGRYWDQPDLPLTPGTHPYRVFETGESLLHLLTDEELEVFRRGSYQVVGDPHGLTASLIFAPLKKRGKTIGTLSVQRQAQNAYTHTHLALVEAVAVQVSIAIENACLFTHLQRELDERQQAEVLTNQVNLELQRRIKELYVLNTVAQAGASLRSEDELLEITVETLYRSLYPDILGVALWDEADGLLRTHPRANRGLPPGIDQTQMTARLHQGIVGEVAATRRPYRLADIHDPAYLPLDPAIKSEVCVPILAGEKLVGVLNVESRQPDMFTEADENLLATIAGQLAAAIERLRAEQALRNLNASLERRVAERTAELQAANRELESFSYTVSHDLRTPLRGINGYARILQDEFSEYLPLEARSYLERVAFSASKMSRLIDDLLSFARIGRKEMQKQRVDLNQTVGEVIEALSPETADRQIAWQVGPLPTVLADQALIQLVYANLVGNAVKYTRGRSPACIALGSFVRHNEIIYFVRDNGAGFDMQYAGKLFGVFQRLHREDEFEGTGIGLATVQRIIQRHGGRIWAEAEPDKGATFYFTLA